MNARLTDALAPIIAYLGRLDPDDTHAAATLNAKFPVDGESMQAIATLFATGVSEKWLCHRDGGPGVSYSRVEKCIGASDMSIDAVRMAGPGPGHAHPKGEFDLCFAVSGTPLFDNRPAGWTVYGPETYHVPTVSGGTMNILYFLPGGAIEFGPKPE